MCGRYAPNTTATELINHFRLISCPEFGVSFNIPPTSIIPVIRYKQDAGRVGQLVKWGLVPSWAKDSSGGATLNNARGETVAEKPSFRTSFAKHRCLIPASGFYEWQTIAGKKQPYYIHTSDPDAFFAFAGLLAAWKSPEGQTLVTTCIITTTPNEVMEPIHDRMPVIIGTDQFDTWLDPQNNNPDALLQLIRPCSPDGMTVHQVKPLRGDVPECIEPISV